MAERIVEILSDADVAVSMGQAGLRIIEENFSLAAQLRRTEELYERLLSPKTREAAGAERMRSESYD
jgi:glycosyltransferase involved in cell wall biosynthesis